MEIMIGTIVSVILVVKYLKEKNEAKNRKKNQENRRTASKYDNFFSSTLEFRTKL